MPVPATNPRSTSSVGSLMALVGDPEVDRLADEGQAVLAQLLGPHARDARAAVAVVLPDEVEGSVAVPEGEGIDRPTEVALADERPLAVVDERALGGVGDRERDALAARCVGPDRPRIARGVV